MGEIPEKSSDKLFQKFRNAGYRRDLYPVDTNGTKDTRSLQFLRDYFYPDFRNLMFLTDIEEETFRYIKLDNRKISLTYGRGERKKTYPIGILKSELYLFKEQIGLFSISIEIQEPHKNLDDISNIISVVKNFDTELENGVKLEVKTNAVKFKLSNNSALLAYEAVVALSALAALIAREEDTTPVNKAPDPENAVAFT